MHAPPQTAVVPAAQHAPCPQNPDGQTLPQTPQLCASLLKSAQVVPQQVCAPPPHAFVGPGQQKC
jgi:hypothetical protein